MSNLLERLTLPDIIDRHPLLQTADDATMQVLKRLRGAENHSQISQLILKHDLHAPMVLSAIIEAHAFARADIKLTTKGLRENQVRLERNAEELARVFEAIPLDVDTPNEFMRTFNENVRSVVRSARWAAEFMRTSQAGTDKMIPFRLSRKSKGQKAERMRFEPFMDNFFRSYIEGEPDRIELVAQIAAAVYASNDQLGDETKQALITARRSRPANTKRAQAGKNRDSTGR